MPARCREIPNIVESLFCLAPAKHELALHGCICLSSIGFQHCYLLPTSPVLPAGNSNVGGPISPTSLCPAHAWHLGPLPSPSRLSSLPRLSLAATSQHTPPRGRRPYSWVLGHPRAAARGTDEVRFGGAGCSREKGQADWGRRPILASPKRAVVCYMWFGERIDQPKENVGCVASGWNKSGYVPRFRGTITPPMTSAWRW
jgi:hypothetical protein